MYWGDERKMIKLIGFYDYTVIVTYLSIVSAMAGMILASKERFTAAVLCLLFSGICDGFDGTIARTKKNRTEDEKAFGIQLDSLCDVVSFGIFPAFLCYCMGTDGVVGVIIVCLYSLCAVCRLGFFNVLEGKRQQAEGGVNKYYRGLPVTSISMIFPFIYIFHRCFKTDVFIAVLCGMLLIVAFLFVLDFRVKKFDVKKIFVKA